MNVVLVGYGYWGPNIARHLLASTKSKLHAVVDIRPQSIERARKACGENISYSQDYREFLNNKKVDAFAIATQTEASYQIALDVLASGKHLFIEKPMASNYKRAQAITELAQKMNRTVHCDHIFIYHPIIRYIKDYYDSGELGELIYFDIKRVNLGPIRKDINTMLDLAVHDIAVIDYISGGCEPYELEAMGEKRYGSQETLTYLTMRYPGFLAHINSSWLSPLKERRIVIGGTKKMLVFDDVRSVDKLAIYDQGIIHRGPDDEYGPYEFKVRTGDMMAPYIPFEDSLLHSIEHFIDCANKNIPSLSGPEQAVRVVKILDQALAKMR